MHLTKNRQFSERNSYNSEREGVRGLAREASRHKVCLLGWGMSQGESWREVENTSAVDTPINLQRQHCLFSSKQSLREAWTEPTSHPSHLCTLLTNLLIKDKRINFPSINLIVFIITESTSLPCHSYKIRNKSSLCPPSGLIYFFLSCSQIPLKIQLINELKSVALEHYNIITSAIRIQLCTLKVPHGVSMITYLKYHNKLASNQVTC